MPPRIVITGIGVVSPFGVGRERYWDHVTRGVSGTVTAVDAGKKEITIRPPSLGTQQLVVVTLKDNAPLRRYAQDSVRFADAKPATINDIKTGDQLRARGEKNPDGSRFEADEVVTGSFQTVAAVERYSLLDQYAMGLVPPKCW